MGYHHANFLKCTQRENENKTLVEISLSLTPTYIFSLCPSFKVHKLNLFVFITNIKGVTSQKGKVADNLSKILQTIMHMCNEILFDEG